MRWNLATSRDLGDETISTARGSGDVASAVLTIAQHLAQRCDVKAQAAFFDHDVGPNLREQFAFADYFVRPGGQCDQRIQGTSAQLERHFVFQQKPFGDQQSERAERNLAL